MFTVSPGGETTVALIARAICYASAEFIQVREGAQRDGRLPWLRPDAPNPPHGLRYMLMASPVDAIEYRTQPNAAGRLSQKR
jgi:uncharacterized Fe-S cluster protein YjdI